MLLLQGIVKHTKLIIFAFARLILVDTFQNEHEQDLKNNKQILFKQDRACIS